MHVQVHLLHFLIILEEILKVNSSDENDMVYNSGKRKFLISFCISDKGLPTLLLAFITI